MSLSSLVRDLRNQPSWQQKQYLQQLSDDWATRPSAAADDSIKIGDDAAVIPRGDSYSLFASELILPELVRENPEMAGRSAILANVHDIYAMGGRPIAVQNVILDGDPDHLDRIRAGLDEGCRRYDVPVVGGHLTAEDSNPVLGASILGEADAILSSFDVEPGQELLMAIHLEGHFQTEHAFWSCTGHRSDSEIQDDLAVLPQLAEHDLASAAKDISMAGPIGTLIMMLEPSSSGAAVDLQAIPHPPEAEGRTLDWLSTFPSYGFVLACDPDNGSTVIERFNDRSIACERIGRVTDDSTVVLHRDSEREVLWDFAQKAFTGFSS